VFLCVRDVRRFGGHPCERSFCSAAAAPCLGLARPTRISDVRRLRHDQRRNWCEVELADGCRAAFSFHLFSTDELDSLFKGIFEIEALEGLDFFHGRFAADPRWNPPGQDFPQALALELAKMERHLSANPEYSDHANQLLLIGRKLATDYQSNKQRPRPTFTPRSARQPSSYAPGQG
jgi:hypothetical protein